MKCEKCNNTLAEDAKFCNKCGAEVKEQKIHCEKCNHTLSKDDKFCEKCGEKVHNKVEVKEENHANKKKTTESARKKNGNKGLIALVIGVVVLAVIILAVVNLKDTDDDPEVSAKEPKNAIEDYSIEGLAEHYNIEEELLTYEEMDEVVTRIKEGLEDHLPNIEESEQIEEIILEEYGSTNARAYAEGLLIKEDMSDSDKKQVMSELVMNYGTPIKNIRNFVQYAYEKEDKNEFVEYGMHLDTEGFYNINDINIGYPVVQADNDLIQITFKVYIQEGVEGREDIESELEKINGIDINGKNMLEHMRSGHIPTKDQLKEYDDELLIKQFSAYEGQIGYLLFEDTEVADYEINDGELVLQVNEEEFKIDLDGWKEDTINPEVIGSK